MSYFNPNIENLGAYYLKKILYLCPEYDANHPEFEQKKHHAKTIVINIIPTDTIVGSAI